MKKKKVRNSIILYLIIILLSIPVYVVLLNLISGTALYSNDNTILTIGTVTNVFDDEHYTGYKQSKITRTYIELENSQTYYVNASILRNAGYDEAKLETTILNEDVEIRYSKIHDGKIVSLSMGQSDILTYDHFNEIAANNRIAFLGVYAFVLIGIAVFVFL